MWATRPALDAYGFPDHMLQSLIDYPLPYVKDLYTDDRVPNWELEEAESADGGQRTEHDQDNRKRKHEVGVGVTLSVVLKYISAVVFSIRTQFHYKPDIFASLFEVTAKLKIHQIFSPNACLKHNR